MPDERDVRSMQRSNQLERVCLAQHLAGEKAGCGVRHCVVDVEYVQSFTQGDLVLFHGQRQRIGEIFQERICRAQVDGVEIDVLGKARQPKG